MSTAGELTREAKFVIQTIIGALA